MGVRVLVNEPKGASEGVRNTTGGQGLIIPPEHRQLWQFLLSYPFPILTSHPERSLQQLNLYYIPIEIYIQNLKDFGDKDKPQGLLNYESGL